MIILPKTSREEYFDCLLQSVHQCDLCPRMANRKKVLSAQNGDIRSRVVFIAEAPGRLGAECTGIPLYGDKTGTNFEQLLNNIGWSRSSVFITNAILCNPQDATGNNATPEKAEIANCSYYLEMILELIKPDVVVTLGAKALEALNLICPHQCILKRDVAQPIKWNGMILFPLYHTGSRAALHRSLTQQRSDFIALSHLVDPQKGLKHRSTVAQRKNTQPTPTEQAHPILADMVLTILRELHEVSFFKLTKLLYLIDYHYFEEFGQTISGSIYLRMQAGPWIPYLKDIIKEYDSNLFRTYYFRKKPFILYLNNDYEIKTLNGTEIEFICQQCARYLNATDANMRTFAYLTEPMKYVLRQEKQGRQMTKIPVLYNNKTVIDIDTALKQEHSPT